MLYLTPSPAAPIEELALKLYQAFPNYHDANYGFPIFHMTIALGNPQEEVNSVVKEYYNRFGKSSLALRAGRLALYGQYEEQWEECLYIELGQ